MTVEEKKRLAEWLGLEVDFYKREGVVIGRYAETNAPFHPESLDVVLMCLGKLAKQKTTHIEHSDCRFWVSIEGRYSGGHSVVSAILSAAMDAAKRTLQSTQRMMEVKE